MHTQRGGAGAAVSPLADRPLPVASAGDCTRPQLAIASSNEHVRDATSDVRDASDVLSGWSQLTQPTAISALLVRAIRLKMAINRDAAAAAAAAEAATAAAASGGGGSGGGPARTGLPAARAAVRGDAGDAGDPGPPAFLLTRGVIVVAWHVWQPCLATTSGGKSA